MRFLLCLAAAIACLAACAGVPEAPARISPIQTVTLDSESWQLAADWRAPEPSFGAAPAVLLLNRAAGSRADVAGLAGALAGRGIASLALDLRGHGGSTNLGRFEPPYADNLHINERAFADVAAALGWLGAQPGIDGSRLAVMGASYSGEAAALACREESACAAAYVMLSPGNFSDESIAAIPRSGQRWLFVRTEEESPAARVHIDALHNALAANSSGAELKVFPGEGHATRMLEGRPEITDFVADWIAGAL